MEGVSITFLGLKFLEPFTFLTDLLITIVCFLIGFRLKKNTHKHISYQNWMFFFFLLGTSTLLAAVAHSFYYYFGKSLHVLAWLVSGLGIYFIELATINILSDEFLKRKIRIFIFIQLFVYSYFVIHYQHFSIVKWNSVIGMMGIVFFVHIFRYVRNFNAGSGFILLGIVMAAVSALIHSLKFSFGKWFNHNDISHLFLCFTFYFLYLGAHKTNLNIKASKA